MRGRPPPAPARPTPELLRDVLSDPGGESNWWPTVDGPSWGHERHSRGATRCGVCGELTEAETCCQVAVW